MRFFTKTKIIVTLGPATDTEQKITALVKAGATIFRLNTSHGTPGEHEQNIRRIRKVAQRLNRHLPILLDLQGPKIRIGELAQPLLLEEGEQWLLTPGTTVTDSNDIPVPYNGLLNDIKSGDRLLLDDGKIELLVTEILDKQILVTVITGGTLTSRKGLNIPGSTSSLAGITAKDKDYITFAVKHDIDLLALSFVRDAGDIQSARRCFKRTKTAIPIIAKIEKPQAVRNMDEILAAADGIMVARGDLGIEMSPENVPIVQKRLIIAANAVRKPVIVATQMLESMIENPLPTRAETSDVANAIFDGTDAIMLSGETSVGKYPVKAVRMMATVARNVESHSSGANYDLPVRSDVPAALDPQQFTLEIARLFSKFDIQAIVVCTQDGASARTLSKARVPVPIIALSGDLTLCRQLNLLWGIVPCYLDSKEPFGGKFFQQVDNVLIKEGLLKRGNKIIITAGLPYLAPDRTNFMRLHRVG